MSVYCVEIIVLSALLGFSAVCYSSVEDPATPASHDFERLLHLPPGQGNPRNSEGDLLKLADGSLLFVWTRFESGTGGDHDPAILVQSRSQDGGQTWGAPQELLRAPDGMNLMSVTLRQIRPGTIALFYLHKRSLLDCRPVVRFSNDGAETWSQPIEIVPSNDVGYDVLNNDRVLHASDGALIVPIARHAGVGVGETFQPNGRLRCYRSEDDGKTWKVGAWSPSEDGVAMQEPGLFETTDGTLRMFARTNAGVQYILDSVDGGMSFGAPRRWTLRSPLSPATVERLPDGDLLALWNEPPENATARTAPRTPLVVARSSDDGLTWGDRVVLFDHADGWYCYVALLLEEDAMLFATCAGNRKTHNGLETTVLVRAPLPPKIDGEDGSP